MLGWQFSKFRPQEEGGASFEKLLKLFQELLLHTSGDVREALSWLTQLDKEYKLTDEKYGMGNFIQDMIDKGYIAPQDAQGGSFAPTSKMEIEMRQKALEDIFGQLKKTKRGNHTTNFSGQGDEKTSEIRPFEFGDALEQIAVSESLRNAQINHGIEEFKLTNEDLESHEQFFQSQTSTVLMIDISHSMILYGEDRITPAKKVAMALAELIKKQYPKDTLDILVFGDSQITPELKKMADMKKVGDRVIKIHPIKATSEIRKCNILFVPANKSEQLPDILAKVGSNAILVVTEQEGLGAKGSGINFVSKEGKLAFEMNQAAMTKQKLKASTELTRLAIVI